MKLPLCSDCGRAAELVLSQKVYPHRPALWNRYVWLCPCGAYVGCHPGTQRALGTPAGLATRKARQAAHAAFDPLWGRKMIRDGVSKTKARKAGYKWLAAQLGRPDVDCHIGEMDAATAMMVVRLCAEVTNNRAASISDSPPRI